MGNDGFSMKEVVLEIKEELRAFRLDYRKDQEKRNAEFAKRPTWTQMTGLLAGTGIIVSIVVSLVGG